MEKHQDTGNSRCKGVQRDGLRALKRERHVSHAWHTQLTSPPTCAVVHSPSPAHFEMLFM